MKVLVAVLTLLPLALGSDLLNSLRVPQGQPVHMNQAPEPCCMPDQVEATIGGFVGLSIDGGQLVFESMMFSYDRTNNRTNVNGTSFIDGIQTKFRVLSLHNEKREYVVDNEGKCTYHMIGDLDPICIPHNATYIGSYRIGLAGEGIELDQWMIQSEGFHILLSAIQSNCLITSEIVYGTLPTQNERMVELLGFTNHSTGIKDQDVFKVPDDCQPGQKKNRIPKTPFSF